MTNLVDDWAREFFRKPEARRRGGEMIPRFIADRLVAADQTAEWCKTCLRDIWKRMQRDRGKKLDRGWAELAGGILVAAELVDETFRRTLLPVEAPVRQCYEEQRWRYARYALVVGNAVQVHRVLVHSGSDGHEYGWQLVGVRKEQLHGRSHTLAIALVDREQRGEVSLPRDRAVATTGAFQEGAILPVRSLAEKSRAWFQREPNGLLITAPPANLDVGAWKSLVLDMGIPQEGQPLQWPHEAEKQKALQRRWDAWITAASNEELDAKLALRFGDGLGEIRAWNNDILAPTHIAPLVMKWAGQSDSRREEPLSTPFLDAVWNAVRNARGEGAGFRGVLVEGEPGAGKSLWSMTVRRQFATGPLGALGHAVRAGARALVERLRHQPVENDLLELLPAETSEQRRLHQRLLDNGRLIIVLDGLDELDEPDARRLVELLQSMQCAFIVTSRPLAMIRHKLGDALRVSIEPLGDETSASILEAHGRTDLAEQLHPNQRGSSSALRELCRRPFTLSLLMGTVPRGASARGLSESELYRRAYQFLIRRALQTQRLTEGQAHVLEHSAGELVGELALAWLRGADGYIRDAETDIALARACDGLRLPVDLEKQFSFWALQDLFREGRRYVTAVHRDQLWAWLAHERAELRYLACSWMGMVGPASWGKMLRAAMNDPHPAVAFAAVRAWCSVEPGKLDAALETLSRTNWTATHYALFIAYWVGDEPRETYTYLQQPLRRASVEPLAPELVVQMMGEACVSLLASEGRDAVGGALMNKPRSDGDERGESLIELFLARAAEIQGDAGLSASLGTLPLRDWAEAAPADGPRAKLSSIIARVIDRWLPGHVPKQERAARSLNEPDAVSEPVSKCTQIDGKAGSYEHGERWESREAIAECAHRAASSRHSPGRRRWPGRLAG